MCRTLPWASAGLPRRYVTWTILLLAGFAPGVPAAAGDRLNVLVVITDDQGYGDFGLHGNPHLKTPHLDAFAKANTRFDRFFVNPVCAPTRAALLTGRYPLRTGVWGVTHNTEAMRAQEVTLAEALKSAGYRTGCFGKWHNGEQYPYTPPGQGFDEFFGFHNGHTNSYFDADLLRGTRLVRTKGYIADVLTDAAIDFFVANRDWPFFCYLAYNTPHYPSQVPDRYFDKYRREGLDAGLASVYGMCENLDDNFGRLLAALDRLKLAERTLVLFLTDNGPNGNRFNDRMRGHKGSVHEGGCRVPLFLRWPGQGKPGQVIDAIVAHIDLYPTVLDLCGIKPPKGPLLDGSSLRPLLEGKTDGWPDRMLFTHHVRGDWKDPYPGAVRTQRYRLVREAKGDWELYDMVADPGQAKDCARDKPEEVKRLAKAYDEWFQDVRQPGCERLPIPVGHPEENPVTLHAPQAYFEGGIRFHGRGTAHDWLTGWKEAKARIWYDVDVVAAGDYEVRLRYACPDDGAGSKVRVSAGDSNTEAIVKPAPGKVLPLPNRDGTKGTYMNRDWAELPLGRLKLAKGKGRILLEAVSTPGRQVLDFKALVLRQVDEP